VLERYGHGGDLRSAAEIYGIEEGKLIDYSSNMNPLGPPSSFKGVIENYWESITTYPDPAQRDLLQAIANKHGVDCSNIIAGNGAAELIQLVVRYIKPGKAAIFVPSFVEYEQAIQKHGCSCVHIETYAEQGFIPTMSQLQATIEKEQPVLVMLGYPNNPTGTLLPKEQLQYLLKSGLYVVIDEAFLDFHPDEEELSTISSLATYERLFVVRSMTKFYSIPGIRLGYLLAHAKHISALKALQVPWSVNSLAQQLGVEALSQQQFAEQTKNWLKEEIPWFSHELQKLGLKPFPTVTNYILVQLSSELRLTSKELQQLMGERGILIRDGGKFRGLDNSYIRLAIKDRGSNESLIHTLQEVLDKRLQEE